MSPSLATAPDPGWTAQTDELNRGAANFYSGANNKVNYAMSYTDPRSGLHLNYDPRSGGAGTGAGDNEREDFDFDASFDRIQRALPPVPAPAQLPAREVASSPADSAAAEASEFGRAKDRIGRLGRGSMTALQNEYSARGLGGSNMEGAATSQLLGDLQGQEGEVIRDQTIQNLQRRRQVEDRNLAAGINQRGQDIGFTTTTRGQDISAADNRAQLAVPLMQLIAANRRRRLY